MKIMMLCVNMKRIKIYFKSRNRVFSDVQVTQNYVLRFKEDLCHALTVGKSFLHLTLSTVVFNSCFQQWRDTIIPSNRLQDNRPGTIIPLSKERLDMAAYTFMYHMENGSALEKNNFGVIHIFRNSCSNIGLKNIHPVTRHLASRKDVSVDSFSHLCQLPLHTFMRIKVTKMKMDTLWYSLDGSTREIFPFVVLPKRNHGLPVH
jgi:hypothetical protein